MTTIYWSPGWIVLLLLLLPTVEGCSSRGAAIYRQTRESEYTSASEAPDRWQAARLAAARVPTLYDRADTAEPLPRAEARVAGPFLIPGDDNVSGDVRPLSISGVEAVAAEFDSSEPESYSGEGFAGREDVND